MVQQAFPLANSEAGGLSALSEELIILHLIATGIIQRANKIEQGKEVNGDYEISLQLGLDRLNILRYSQALPLIKSIPDLMILLANCPEQGREKYEILNEKQVVK